MKTPLTPPNYGEILTTTIVDPDLHSRVLAVGSVDGKGRYLHWDTLRHLVPPDSLTSEQWWAGMKLTREKGGTELPFCSVSGVPFWYCLPPAILEQLHWLDVHGTGASRSSLAGGRGSEALLRERLAEEAISSSQLEGASTSSPEAREMLRQGRAPRDKGEQMIANNYQAMQFVQEIREDSLTPSMVFELHRILIENTLADPEKAGHLRTDADDICVMDGQRRVLHRPPPEAELSSRLEKLCEFANQEDDRPFMHPVVRAIILHFMLAYDHPFVDGNGRTARVLFYWSMVRHGYELLNHLSISSILKKGPGKYARVFLLTETDGGDLTYFIEHQLGVLSEAVAELRKELEVKQDRSGELEKLLPENSALRRMLNTRQLELLGHAVKAPGHV